MQRERFIRTEINLKKNRQNQLSLYWCESCKIKLHAGDKLRQNTFTELELYTKIGLLWKAPNFSAWMMVVEIKLFPQIFI